MIDNSLKLYFLKKIDFEFNNLQKHAFVSSAQRCESKDVFIEKNYKRNILTVL